MYRKHKCEVPVFPGDDDVDSCVAPAPVDPAPVDPEPAPDPAPVELAPGPPEVEQKLTGEAISLIFKQARDEKRAAKRRLYAQSMFG